jgi:hypothetical protein
VAGFCLQDGLFCIIEFMSEEISRQEAEERGHSRPRSGFADPSYWSPEKREAQSQLAKKMYEEGRFGGKQPGAGRPKIKTVTQVIAEEAQKDGIAIYKELKRMMLQSRSDSVKLGAMDRVFAREDQHQKLMRDDEKEVLKLSGKSLDAAVSEALAEFNLVPDIELSDEDIMEISDGEENEQ